MILTRLIERNPFTRVYWNRWLAWLACVRASTLFGCWDLARLLSVDRGWQRNIPSAVTSLATHCKDYQCRSVAYVCNSDRSSAYSIVILYTTLYYYTLADASFLAISWERAGWHMGRAVNRYLRSYVVCGLRTSSVLSLPENIFLHLKRFTHPDLLTITVV